MTQAHLPKPPAPRFCRECGSLFYTTDGRQKYCGSRCKTTRNNRAVKAGYKLYWAVVNWRIDRPRDALSELTSLADQFATEERLIRQARAKRMKEHRAAYIAAKTKAA